jgi:hypothetical protein
MLKHWINPYYAFNRAITPYDPCGDEPGLMVPESDCLEEGSRIIGAFAVPVAFDLATLVDVAAVDTAITAGNLIVIKGLSGNWAPGSSNKKPGMGFNREKHSSFTYAIPLKHYSVDGNMIFWNTLNQQIGWSLIFIFEDFAPWGALDKDSRTIPMDIVMTPASDDELGGQRRFEGTTGWTTKSLPYTLLAPVVPGFTVAKLSALFK